MKGLSDSSRSSGTLWLKQDFFQYYARLVLIVKIVRNLWLYKNDKIGYLNKLNYLETFIEIIYLEDMNKSYSSVLVFEFWLSC